MSKIYFRRQATVPPTGTNGICVFCTTNETLYLDGIPYGAGSSKGSVTGLTKETWWDGVTEIEINDGKANIDLTDVARQSDVKRLLDDVFVIKNELELSGPLNPSGDPRSAIDILNEDITKVNKDLQLTKVVVSGNTANISANTKSIGEININLSAVSANTITNAKNIALADDRIGKLESRERDITYSAETMQVYEQEMKNMIIAIDDTYVSAITFNGSKEFKPIKKVVNITAKTWDAEIADLSASTTAINQHVGNVENKLLSLSSEVVDFEEQVGDDIENISDKIDFISGSIDAVSGIVDNEIDYISGEVDTKLSGVSVDGVALPVSACMVDLKNVGIEVSGKTIIINDLTGGSVSAKLPLDVYISGGSYDAKTEQLILNMTDGTQVKVDVKGLVDVYTADENTINLISGKFSVSTALTQQISDNTDNIAYVSGHVQHIEDTYISGAVVNGVQGKVSGHVVSVDIPVVSIKSDDNSVVISSETSGANVTYNLQVLTKEIREYLSGLTEYKYTYSASQPSDITITVPTMSGATYSILSAGKYRGLDYPTYSVDNQQDAGVSGSSSNSTGWVKDSAKKWTYTYTLANLSAHTATANSFNATVLNNDGKSGTTNTVTPKITIKKPWLILEGTAKPTNIDTYLTTPSSAIANGTYTKNGSVSFTIKNKNDYFFVCCPSNYNAKFQQVSSDQIETTPTVINTKYGQYKIYQSNAQQQATKITGTLIIS